MSSILGHGVDLVETARIREAIQAHGERFVERVYTPAEAAYCRSQASPWASFAARWAAKEAAYKAYGHGWPAGWMREVEVLREASGRPQLRLLGASAAAQSGRGVLRTELSLSHARELAMASVLLVG